MKLYDLEASGNCYKVRLFASLANIALERVPVDFLDGAHKRPPISTLNPLGQLPALAPEGGVDLGPYGHIARWMKRIEELPGYLARP